ncbi:MAG: co-chaperone GroES [Parcubacteria group bacterium RIFCSPHIGHO2_01_FULL_47_10b]|nr:MAG: co-chaperone GroES [Parcubacteria group bacterium RIFCSPHIGHO2_01_FULL_47_10b]
MKLQPLHDHIVLQPLTEEKKTKGGIVLPETVDKDKPEMGKVLAVGPGKRDDSGKLIVMGVKIGDKVLFKSYAPDEFEIDGDKVLVAKESDILAIIK